MASDPMLKSTIQFWEVNLSHNKFLMDPSTQTFVEYTIKYLKELQEIKEGKDHAQEES